LRAGQDVAWDLPRQTFVVATDVQEPACDLIIKRKSTKVNQSTSTLNRTIGRCSILKHPEAS
jgi:hypothetical protein